MNGETILAVIVMTGIGLGMGALFFWMGVWAASRKDPMHFWSGSTVDPRTISDVPAYNLANGRMWKWYSAPYWLSGICALLGIFHLHFLVLSAVFMVAACTVGIWWLVREYRRICKEYKLFEIS